MISDSAPTSADLNNAVIQLAIMRGFYDDSNPEVGMGPTPSLLVSDALQQLGWDKSRVDFQLCVDRVFDARRRHR